LIITRNTFLSEDQGGLLFRQTQIVPSLVDVGGRLTRHQATTMICEMENEIDGSD
jgi:hypothetical protein